MEQQSNNVATEDAAGVLPMDSGASGNVAAQENEEPSLSSAPQKRGRGRPKKLTSAKRESSPSQEPPAKSKGTKRAASPINVKEESDNHEKKRGRPSKNAVKASEPPKETSKLQVVAPAPTNKETKENTEDEVKRKRGRPPAPEKKKPVASQAAEKGSSTPKKRGRPSKFGKRKKSPVKTKAAESKKGSDKKRGRPRKSGAPSNAHSSSNNATENSEDSP